MSRLFVIGSVFAILLVMLASRPARAQTIHDAGFWSALFAQGVIHQDESNCRQFLWWFDGHARFLDDADFFNQSIVRPGLGMTLGENAAIWIGYGWIRTAPVGGAIFDEDRIWQQLTWSKKRESVTFAARSRLEQRFIETGADTGWRWRQLLRAQHNLPQFPHLILVCWDELFVHLNDTDWGAESGFDQNRLFAGFGWKFDPEGRWRVEVGYLNQVINVPRNDNVNNHILSINLYRSR